MKLENRVGISLHIAGNIESPEIIKCPDNAQLNFPAIFQIASRYLVHLPFANFHAASSARSIIDCTGFFLFFFFHLPRGLRANLDPRIPVAWMARLRRLNRALHARTHTHIHHRIMVTSKFSASASGSN